MGVVVRLRILVKHRFGAVQARNRGRALVLDHDLRERLVQLHRRVALNHHRRRRQHEDGRGDPAVAVKHRHAIQNVHVAFRRERSVMMALRAM